MSLKLNILANYLGQGWTALMGIVFIPLYIRYLGIESYGLIGLLATLQAIFILLDLGITPTLIREMARFSAKSADSKSIRCLLRTLEIISFVAAFTGALAVFLSSEWIAISWLRVEKLSYEQTSQAVALLGIVAGMRLLEGLYRGALIGLQKQVWLNGIVSLLATVRGVGAIAVLTWWSSTIVMFLLWQVFVSLVTVTILSTAVYRELPSANGKGQFSLMLLKKNANFSSGMLVNSVLAVILTQSDRILLSRILTLEEFGYYTFAVTIASIILQIVVPISQAYYPHLTKILEIGDTSSLIQCYHLSAQLVGAVIFPIGIMLATHGKDILYMWSGNTDLGNHIVQILSLVALGNILHGAMYMPNMLRLAHGWAWLSVRINGVAVLVLVPSIIWAASYYGAKGAAWAWFALNLGYVILGVPYIHKKMLPEEIGKWFKEDLCFPLFAASSVLVAASCIPHVSNNRVVVLIYLCFIGTLSLSAGVLSSTLLRQKAIGYIRRLNLKQ